MFSLDKRSIATSDCFKKIVKKKSNHGMVVSLTDKPSFAEAPAGKMFFGSGEAPDNIPAYYSQLSSHGRYRAYTNTPLSIKEDW